MAIIILLAFTALAWFVLILPRQRELKRHQALMSQLEVGEEIMMTSGVYGVIRSIDGDYVQLEIADGLCIKIAKRSIAARVEEPDALDGGAALGGSGDVPTPATSSSVDDSDDSGSIGQNPVSEAESDPVRGYDGDEAVIDLDGEIDSAKGNEG